jgi:hypothetical protein
MAVLRKLTTGSNKEGAYARLTIDLPLDGQLRDALAFLADTQSPAVPLELTIAHMQAKLRG